MEKAPESGATSLTGTDRLLGLSDAGMGRMMSSLAPPFIVIVQIG